MGTLRQIGKFSELFLDVNFERFRTFDVPERKTDSHRSFSVYLLRDVFANKFFASAGPYAIPLPAPDSGTQNPAPHLSFRATGVERDSYAFIGEPSF